MNKKQEKAVEKIKRQMSANSKKLAEIILKKMERFNKKKKQNSYVETRDAMVISASILFASYLHIEDVHTTESSRKELRKIGNEMLDVLLTLREEKEVPTKPEPNN